MSFPQDIPNASSSPRSLIADHDGSPTRYRNASVDSDRASHVRYSPTLTRGYNPLDPDVRERQRTLDVDMALHLSLARRESISASPVVTTLSPRDRDHDEPRPHAPDTSAIFPGLSLHEEQELSLARGAPPSTIDEAGEPYQRTPTPEDLRMPHLSQGHDPSLLVSLDHDRRSDPDPALPMYQAALIQDHSNFNFGPMEEFAAAEKARLGLSASPERHPPLIRHRASQGPEGAGPGEGSAGSPTDSPFPLRRSARQRKLSHSNAAPRRQGRKMALFEGSAGAPPASLARATHLFASGVPGAMSTLSSEEHLPTASPPTGAGTGHDRPYRFSFYSNGLSATIHARSLSELPAEGQAFEDLFGGASGLGAMGGDAGAVGPIHIPAAPQSNGHSSFHGSSAAGGAMYANGGNNGNNNGSSKTALNDQRLGNDPEGQTWWLDVLSPTDEEMKMLSRVRATRPSVRLSSRAVLIVRVRRSSISTRSRRRISRWRRRARRSSCSGRIISSASAASTRTHSARRTSNRSTCTSSSSARARFP